MDEMNMINIAVQEAQKLNTALKNAVMYANNISKEAEEKIKVASEISAVNDFKAKELAEREVKVLKIENIVRLDKDGKALMEEAKKLMAKLEADKTDFLKERTDTLKAVAIDRAKNSGEHTALEKAWEKVRQLEAELIEKRKTLKEEVIRDLKSLKI